jgi:hypothetical protein
MASRNLVVVIAVVMGLFFGGGAIGTRIASWLAPESRFAEIVSFLALPVAFLAGLQAWYGLAFVSMIPHLFRRLSRTRAFASPNPHDRSYPLPGSIVFLPISSIVGALTGLIVGVVTVSHSFWLVVLVYWFVGTLYGLVTWRLAHAGFLQTSHGP